MSSHIASFIAAVWSLIRIGIIPGESSNSRSLPKRTHLLQENENQERDIERVYRTLLRREFNAISQKCNGNGFTKDSPPSFPVYILVNNIEMQKKESYFNSLVTPGLGAAGHIRRFSKRLIRDDFPTLGYPTIPARTYRIITKVG